MKTKRSKNHIRARFFNRAWAVNLSVNGEPVNHDLPEPPISSWIVYRGMRSESVDAAVERFSRVLARVAATSRRGPTLFDIVCLNRCAAPVIESLTVLLSTGQAGPLPGGSQFKLNTDNLIVNLWLDESDTSTAEAVARIVG